MKFYKIFGSRDWGGGGEIGFILILWGNIKY